MNALERVEQRLARPVSSLQVAEHGGQPSTTDASGSCFRLQNFAIGPSLQGRRSSDNALDEGLMSVGRCMIVPDARLVLGSFYSPTVLKRLQKGRRKSRDGSQQVSQHPGNITGYAVRLSLFV